MHPEVAQEVEHRIEADLAQQIRRGDVARISERLTWQQRAEEMSVNVDDASGPIGQVRHDVGRTQQAAIDREGVDEGLERAAGRALRATKSIAPAGLS